MPILTLDSLCQSLAPVFTAMGLPAPSAYDVLDELTRQDTERRARLDRALAKRANRGPVKRLPLRDERGAEYGLVSDEIPEELYFNLRAQKRFGAQGWESAEGRADVTRAWPQLKVQTVSGKATSGWTPASRRTNWHNANFNGLKLAT